MPTSSSPKVQIDVRGVCFTVETLKLSSYSPFLASVFNSINVCPCEPQLLIMTDLQPDQVEEALGALAGKWSSIRGEYGLYGKIFSMFKL